MSLRLEPPVERKSSVDKNSLKLSNSTFYVDSPISHQLNCSLQLAPKSQFGVPAIEITSYGSGSMPNHYVRRSSATSLNGLFVPSHRKSRSLETNNILANFQANLQALNYNYRHDIDKRKSCDDALNSSTSSFGSALHRTRCLLDDSVIEEDPCDVHASGCELSFSQFPSQHNDRNNTQRGSFRSYVRSDSNVSEDNDSGIADMRLGK